MEDLIKGFDGKPNLLTYDIYGGDKLLFPTDKNVSQVNTANILKTVLGNAGIKFKLEKFEDLKEHLQVNRMKRLAGL